MGIFANIIQKAARALGYAETLTGAPPVYTLTGRDVFGADIVQSAIGRIVGEVKKLQPVHVRSGRGADESAAVAAGGVQAVLDDPNPLMTTADFIEKATWALMLNDNAFIMPTFTTKGSARRYDGLWPLNPSSATFQEDSQGVLYICLRFAGGYETTVPYSDVIHLRRKYSANDFLGGDASGRPDNASVAETIRLNRELLHGIAKAMGAACAVNGAIKYNSMLSGERMDENVRQFNEMLKDNSSGFLHLDMKGEFIPIKRDVKFVDAETVRFLDEKILRYFGVPAPILAGDYTPQQFEAFYSATLEPLAVMFSQAFTKALFTPRERSFGNKVVFMPGEMVFMTTGEKLEMVRLLGDSGALFENEKRRAFGLAAIPDLEGVRMMSLNYVDSAIARQYQTGGAAAGEAEGGGQA